MSVLSASNNNSSLTTLLKGEIELQVPLAIGTLQWGTTWVDDKLINSKGVLSESTVKEIVDIITTENGITLYDTAEGYGGGTSEKRLGRLFNNSSSSSADTSTASATTTSPNNKVILMTKFLPVPWRYSHKCFENAVRNSCKRLNVSCIDIYLMHSPVHPFRSIEYWIESGSICYKKGLIRAMGLSNCNAKQVEDAVLAGRKYGVPVICNQVHYSLLCYNSKQLQEMEQICIKYDVKIVGYSPIGQGLLTDTLNEENFKSNRPAKMLKLKYSEIEQLRNIIQILSIKYKKSMAQIALNWCICHNVIPLVGCRSIQQAKDTVGCLLPSSDEKQNNSNNNNRFQLSKDDVKLLDRYALDKSTLESPKTKRMIMVSIFGVVMVICKTLDYFGYGMVKNAKK